MIEQVMKKIADEKVSALTGAKVGTYDGSGNVTLENGQVVAVGLLDTEYIITTEEDISISVDFGSGTETGTGTMTTETVVTRQYSAGDRVLVIFTDFDLARGVVIGKI